MICFAYECIRYADYTKIDLILLCFKWCYEWNLLAVTKFVPGVPVPLVLLYIWDINLFHVFLSYPVGVITFMMNTYVSS